MQKDRILHLIIKETLTNGLLKFLTRFSGRRRISQVKHENHRSHSSVNQRTIKLTSCRYFNCLAVFIFLLLSAICDVTDACRSRTIYRPKTTVAPTPSPRPNITFHTYKCPDAYANWYCLNDATCFAVKLGMEVLYNCECKDGYIGPRCDYKDLDGSYFSSRSRVMLETASIAGGAVAGLLLACIVGLFVYLKKQHSTKECEFEVESQQINHHHDIIKLHRCQGCQISDQFTIVIKYHNG